MERASMDDGRDLEYVELGDPQGQAVIHLHGMPNTAGSAVFWDDAARRHQVRLVAVSRPGYGASTTTAPGLASVGRDVAQLAVGLGIEDFAVVGVSGGGPYALAVATQAPSRVRAVLVAAGPGPCCDVAPELLDEADLRAIELLASGDPMGAVAVVTQGVA